MTATEIGDPSGHIGEIVRVRYDAGEEGVKAVWVYIVDISVTGAKAMVVDDHASYPGRRFPPKTTLIRVPSQALR